MPLGRSLGAALKEHERLLALEGQVVVRPGSTIGTCIERYVREHFPTLSEATKRTRRSHFKHLRPVFGDAIPDNITATDIYAYKNARRGAPGQANGEIGTLSHLFTKMIEWGAATKNPCFRITKYQVRRRKRVPSIDELSLFCAFAKNPMIPLYVQLKLAWGLRKADMLALPRVPADATHIDIEISKSRRWNEQEGKRVGETRRLIITPALREVIRQIQSLPGRPDICQALFAATRGKRRGKRYTEGGFDSIFKTVQDAWLKAGGAPFREHDIRASTATIDPAGAKRRLGHKYQSTTDIYLRQFDIEEVQPLEVSLSVKR